MIIGIIGGMGPLSTIEFLKKIVEKTPAKKDQDHIRIIVDINSKIPDRTAHILGRGECPLPYLLDSVERLIGAGVDVILISCNTAHYYIEDMRKRSNVPIIDLVEEGLKILKKRGIDKILLLATEGTIKSGIYKTRSEKIGIEIVEPNEDVLNITTKVIYSVKSGNLDEAKEYWKKLSRYLDEEADIFLGCTELSLVADRGIDVLDLWSDAVIEISKVNEGSRK
ncbi:MAG TPA: aspartate/glutamate racemase family protein [Thermotoga sp.]|nr:aspartate/glutamate racemase family protein [Thermotoga sp.]